MRYQLLVAEQSDLELEVNLLLVDGWELHGPTVFARMTDAIKPFKPEPLYAQAMVSVTEKPKRTES